ncbi:CwfJ C-terminus 1-domain-containing protein-like protein [Vararia minispora EC-137]|uniref:CwfJ C-terminus 1-domain-containing protein-like protein n=1 Tax=Vararia minispora EC-137 TaxID=1314806 RepID=A0ACB8QY56_9AGAM|nr:CwfJ C-terminus 1-domain-containing protein-like protein [Vararia minispora EC-137]
MWVEKNIDIDGEVVRLQDIPTAESLKLTSCAYEKSDDPPALPSLPPEPSLKRDEWMLEPSIGEVSSSTSRPNLRLSANEESMIENYGDATVNLRTLGGSVDFFSSLGSEKVRRPPPDRPNPDEVRISSKELNTQLREGKELSQYTDPSLRLKTTVPGGPGSQWRMMRLRRVYETAEEENQPVEEVAVERFGSLEAFEQAKEERRILDEREGRPAERGRSADRLGAGKDRRRGKFGKGGEKGFMFTDAGGSGASSRSESFRRPAAFNDTAPSTPTPGPSRPRYDALRMSSSGPATGPRTPIPSVMTPQASILSKRAISPSSLNKLQARVLRAKLMGGPEAVALEKEYEEALTYMNEGGVDDDGRQTLVEVLPTLDGRGRLYDVGQGKSNEAPLPGNRKEKDKIETRDSKTGDIVRYNADDDKLTLSDMLRQERFGAGMADQKNLDSQLARSIMTDGSFQNDLEYMDDNAEQLGRQKMRSDAMKRQFAINDYKRTQKVLASCPYCYGEDDSPPKAPVVALGTRVYLCCTTHEELVLGHCLIVPIQHHLTMLEADDDVWDEVRNFMKSLMRMFAERDQGVVFYETVLTFKWQKHTVIECVPMSWEKFDVIPGYFKVRRLRALESILMSETEWSQHKKLIDFSTRGGFRRMMVPNLPYFMVQFDHKGEKGYGHVIEGTAEAVGDLDDPMDEGEKGGGEFPPYFAAEIIGNVLEIEPPGKWRRPRRLNFSQNKDRVARFKKMYDQFDWTRLLKKS